MQGRLVLRVQRAVGIARSVGYFGPTTLTAVKSFQRRNGLKPTGVVDADTWRVIIRSEKAAGRNNPSTTPPPPPAAPTGDVTRSAEARSSRSFRASVSVADFANSAYARMVVRRESGGQCSAVNPSGKYRGKWQMDSAFWRAYGGLSFAASPDRATCAEQDIVAWRGWVDRWWSPWAL